MDSMAHVVKRLTIGDRLAMMAYLAWLALLLGAGFSLTRELSLLLGGWMEG